MHGHILYCIVLYLDVEFQRVDISFTAAISVGVATIASKEILC